MMRSVVFTRCSVFHCLYAEDACAAATSRKSAMTKTVSALGALLLGLVGNVILELADACVRKGEIGLRLRQVRVDQLVDCRKLSVQEDHSEDDDDCDAGGDDVTH
jgi:hypothetical protein